MSNTNDFLPFCPTDTGTNLESQADYILDTSRIDGNQPGVASSRLNNKAIRQGTFITSQLAQFVSNALAQDVLDNGNASTFLAQLVSWGKVVAGSQNTGAKTASFSFAATDTFILSNATSGAQTGTLPTAVGITGKVYGCKKTDSSANAVTLATTSAQTIDGASSFLLVDQGDYVQLQSDGANWFVIAKGIGAQVVSRSRFENFAGFGSTNTKIARIETSVIATGNAITIATSATNGNSYTINQSGLYSIVVAGEGSASAVRVGLSLNSNQLTTVINSITNTARLGFGEPANSGFSSPCPWNGRLNAGDVIRPHTDGLTINNNTACYFDIQKIGL